MSKTVGSIQIYSLELPDIFPHNNKIEFSDRKHFFEVIFLQQNYLEFVNWELLLSLGTIDENPSQ